MIKGHGDDAYKYDCRIRSNFSSNVFSHVDLEPLLVHLRGSLGAIRNYPEPEPYRLERALADRLGITPDEVCVTSGATEAIYLIAMAFRGSHSTIFQPAFSEYADACRLHGHTVTAFAQAVTVSGHPSGGTDKPCRERFVLPECPSRTSSAQSLVWICNPNNPTGSVLSKAELASLFTAHPDTVFVIDASYEFFTREPLLSAAEALRYPNVILLHSMTKRYAMPGIRLGYMTAPTALLERIRACRMPWSVNALAVEAGLFLTAHPDTAPIDLDALLAETQRLRSALDALSGVSVRPTRAHFMLASLEKGRAADLKEFLARRHGILIRDASNFAGLDERYFRIATQTPAENDALVASVADWLSLQESAR